MLIIQKVILSLFNLIFGTKKNEKTIFTRPEVLINVGQYKERRAASPPLLVYSTNIEIYMGRITVKQKNAKLVQINDLY